jgi:acetyl-CoA acetyltransferase
VENSDARYRRSDLLRLSQDIVKVEGGATARGQPVGATEIVLTVRFIHRMRRAGFERGIRGGEDIALAL